MVKVALAEDTGGDQDLLESNGERMNVAEKCQTEGR